jgi:hypothetical protein
VSRARDVVTAAYAALERASDETSEASGLLRKAYDAALAGEKAHRRMGAGLGGHPMRAPRAPCARIACLRARSAPCSKGMPGF